MKLEEGWKNTINDALTNKAWDDYDEVIKTEVQDYFTRFGFSVDWKIFKAQVWTESGAKSPAWKTRPMQIGNPGDKAYAVMKNGRENSDLILSDSLKQPVKTASINEPKFNVRLGIAYVFTKLATFGSKVTDPTAREYIVKSGDTVEAIAKAIGSTLNNIVTLNMMADPGKLQVGQKLKYQKARIQVTGCPAITPEALHKNYNGNRDPAYAEKIKYCQEIIEQVRR